MIFMDKKALTAGSIEDMQTRMNHLKKMCRLMDKYIEDLENIRCDLLMSYDFIDEYIKKIKGE